MSATRTPSSRRCPTRARPPRPRALRRHRPESVDSGHNQLANVAGIAVGGTASGFQVAGGQHYDDAILVQANLVTDTSKVTVGDTHTLANEVVAFTGVHDMDPTPAATDTPTTTHTDPTVNHDLFHGVMS